jgi:hypothetical protein
MGWLSDLSLGLWVLWNQCGNSRTNHCIHRIWFDSHMDRTFKMVFKWVIYGGFMSSRYWNPPCGFAQCQKAVWSRMRLVRLLHNLSNIRSLKQCRCEWTPTILRMFNSRLPSMRFSHFRPLFDFSLSPNRLNADFLHIKLLVDLLAIPQNKNQAQSPRGSSSKCNFFGSGFWHCK